MSTQDLAFATRLSDTMNWQLSEEDFKFMMELEPKGCFVLFYDSEKAGIVTTVSFGEVGWLGNLIVSEKYRRKGGGSLLVRRSIEYLTSKNVKTVGLYAYLDKIPFYQSFGFESNSEFVTMKGKAPYLSVKSNPREVRKEDVNDVINYDRLFFGVSRRKLLEPILLNPDNLCYISVENDRICGYVASKVYEAMAEIGPLVCRPGRIDIAIELLKTVLGSLEGFEIITYVPRKESTILHMLMSSGFSEIFPLARMFYGHPVMKECIYMAESLERG